MFLCYVSVKRKKERKKEKQALTFCEGTESGTGLVGGRYSRKILADYDKGQRKYFSSTTSAQAEADYSQVCSGWALYVGPKTD